MIRNQHNATSFYCTVELLPPITISKADREVYAAVALVVAARRRAIRNEKRKANWTGRVRIEATT